MRRASPWSLLSAAGLLAAALLPCAAPAAEPVWAERPEEEVYVFGLQLDRYTLTDGLIVFYDGEEAFAPLGALAGLLEFPIVVDPVGGTASGWLLGEDRRFELDLAAGALEVGGRGFAVDPAAVERHPDDLYVSLTELERWFPILLELRFDQLAIGVTALEPLPLQQRIAREERRHRLRRGGDAARCERVEPQEQWFGWPFVDTSMEVSTRRRTEGLHGSGRVTTTVAGIVAGLDGEATAIADSDQEAPNIRVRLGRRSLDGGLLGPLDAHEFALGDVSSPDLALVADSTVGRGIEVSTFGLDRLAQTNRVTLRGELPVGWEVELYRNGELIDFQTDGDVGDARYEFANVDTVAGLNVFRVVFYGPQGQQRELVETYFVSPEFVEPGQTAFRFAANQRNRDLIEFDEPPSNRPDDGAGRVVMQVEHGITETLSVGAGAASLSVDGVRHHYGSVNIQTSLFGALAQLDAAVEDSGGVALGGRLQTRLDGWSLFAEQSFFDGFHSEQTDNGATPGHLRSRTGLRLNGHLPDLGFGNMPVSASVAHDLGEDGDWQTNVFGRLSAVVRPFNFALSSNTRLRRGQESDSDARLLVGTLLGDFRLRGEAVVDLVPEAALDQVLLNADWRLGDGFGARAGLRHQAGDFGRTSVVAGLNYQFEHVAVGANLEVDDEGDYSALFGLSFSVGRDPRDGRIEVRPRPFARRGAVSAQVFLDRDYDGVFDPDEPPIAGAGFSGARLPRGAQTGDDGGAFIVGVEPYRETEIGLNEATLEDPFWVSAREPVAVVSRPGSTTSLLFPVIETGEIDGTVTVVGLRDGRLLPGAGLRIILTDMQGRLVAETKAAYDGYYFLDRIPYGTYRVLLDARQLAALGYASQQARIVTIGAEEPFAVGQDFTAPPDPVATAAGRSTTGQTD